MVLVERPLGLLDQREDVAEVQDPRARSLRQLDLNTRLLKYPCSYMIYSAAFDAMPPLAKSAVYLKLLRELPKREGGQAILEILRATKKDFT